MAVSAVDMALYEIFERYNRWILLPARALLYNFILSFGAGELITEIARKIDVSELIVKAVFILFIEVLVYFYVGHLEKLEAEENKKNKTKSPQPNNLLNNIKLEDLRLSDIDPKLITGILKYLLFLVIVFTLGLGLLLGFKFI
jgi:large-conductance mechanosensitive channel